MQHTDTHDRSHILYREVFPWSQITFARKRHRSCTDMIFRRRIDLRKKKKNDGEMIREPN